MTQAQAIVRSAYQNVLRRDPDPASAGWVNRVFNDHWSQQQLENELRWLAALDDFRNGLIRGAT
jgi:hypothetical protein